MRLAPARLAGFALAAHTLGACAAWQPRPVPAPVAGGGGPPVAYGRVLLTLRDGRVVTLRDAAVVGDSLVGRQDASPPGAGRVAIAVADVQALEVRRVSAGRTLALVVGAAATAGLVWLALVLVVLSMSDT